MNKKQHNEKLKYLFKLPKDAIIVYYRNPKEFSRLELEYVNPDHVIYIWGLLRKKYCWCKQTYKIKMGKIKIPIIIVFANIREQLITFCSNVVAGDILNLCIYILFSVFFVYMFMVYPVKFDIFTHPLIHLIRR